jgi:hypothetical protein
MPNDALKPGAIVRDTRTARLGEFMEQRGGVCYLRPHGGGREWTAPASTVEVVPPFEALGLRVALANRRSAEGLFPQPEPQPLGDCERCRELARERFSARERRDLSAVSDANVLMRKHQREVRHP